MRIAIVIFCLLLSVRSNGNHLVILLSPKDCVSCSNILQDVQNLRQYYQNITIAFPQRYQRDSASLFEALPNISSKIFSILWTDTIIPGSERENVSAAYYLDNKNNILAKMPLKVFNPLTMLLNVPSQHGITYADTIQTANQLPNVLSGVAITNDRIVLIDKLSASIVFLHKRFAPLATFEAISGKQLLRNAYFKYYGDDFEQQIELNQKRFTAENIGRGYELGGINQSGDTISVIGKFYYPYGIYLDHFNVLFNIKGNSIINSYIIIDSTKIYSDNADKEIFKKIGMSDGLIIDSTTAKAMIRMSDSAYKSIKLNYPQHYTINGNSIVPMPGRQFIFSIIQNDSSSYKFVGEYSPVRNLLVPTGRTYRIERGKVFKENQLKRHMASLKGRYPYIMHGISNELYDLSRDTAFTLPLPLGNYDYSLDAMRKLKPRIGLNILDVTHRDSEISILYTLNSAPEIKLIRYDIVKLKTLKEETLSINGQKLIITPEVEIKFDGPNIFYFADPINNHLIRYFIN